MAARQRQRRPSIVHVPRNDQRELVRVLVANGISYTIIANIFEIDLKTLKKYYRAELTLGFERVKAAIGAAVVKSALAGNVAAQKFWLLTHCHDEWKLPKIDAETAAMLGDVDPDDPWVIMMPENGRDKPEREEQPEPVTIEGAIEDQAA